MISNYLRRDARIPAAFPVEGGISLERSGWRGGMQGIEKV